MGRADIFHQSAEGLHIIDGDWSSSPLCVDNKPSRVVGIVSQIDQDVDLSAPPTDPADDAGVRRDAIRRRQLIGHHASDEALVKLPLR